MCMVVQSTAVDKANLIMFSAGSAYATVRCFMTFATSFCNLDTALNACVAKLAYPLPISGPGKVEDDPIAHLCHDYHLVIIE